MEKQEGISQIIREYFINKYSVSATKITADASLLFDFEISGDDVDELFS